MSLAGYFYNLVLIRPYWLFYSRDRHCTRLFVISKSVFLMLLRPSEASGEILCIFCIGLIDRASFSLFSGINTGCFVPEIAVLRLSGTKSYFFIPEFVASSFCRFAQLTCPKLLCLARQWCGFGKVPLERVPSSRPEFFSCLCCVQEFPAVTLSVRPQL